MAIQRQVLNLQTLNDANVNAARIRFFDDVDTTRVTVLGIRLVPGYDTRIEAVDPHPVIPWDFLPAVQSAMTAILGVDKNTVILNEGLTEGEKARRYS